jgi:hypothetical protein
MESRGCCRKGGGGYAHGSRNPGHACATRWCVAAFRAGCSGVPLLLLCAPATSDAAAAAAVTSCAAVWAPAIEVPVAMPICATTGTLQIPTEDKMAIVKRRLGSLPPSVFSTLDKNGDGYLTPDELREGFEVGINRRV